MAKITAFDVLIVYTHRLATSANSRSVDVLTPFTKGPSNENCNIAYGYFLEVCQKNKLKAAFTTSSDITGAGQCKSYWLFENNCWIKVKKTGYSKIIFDKFSPINKKIEANRHLLFSSRKVKPFNHPYLFNLFFDKRKAYKKLYKFSIPTVAIKDSTKKSIDRAFKMLKEITARHPHQNDFSNDFIMKNRFGAGGRNVYKFKVDQPESMMASMRKNNKISYIIQPFVKFDKGFSYQNSLVSTDIRLIYLGGKIIQTYIRMAKVGSFLCNEHRGGTLKYILKNEVPPDVVVKSNKIAKILNKQVCYFRNKNCSLFSLDFIISNNGNIYLLEGNTGPGLDWNLSIKENEIEAKKLIRIIVKKLVELAVPTNSAKKEANYDLIDTPIINKLPRSKSSILTQTEGLRGIPQTEKFVSRLHLPKQVFDPET